MENKYYTPSIEEFHVGFIYEYMNGDKWEENEFIENDCYGTLAKGYENQFEEIHKKLRDVRVKYLDSSDIESLGFEYLKDEYPWKVFKNKQGFFIHFKHEFDCMSLIISVDEFGYTGKSFHGEIKNISELKVLLKQINNK